MANPAWVKGMRSPNPTGRPNINEEFKELLKAAYQKGASLVPLAVKITEKALKSPKVDYKTKLGYLNYIEEKCIAKLFPPAAFSLMQAGVDLSVPLTSMQEEAIMLIFNNKEFTNEHLNKLKTNFENNNLQTEAN